MHNQSMTTLTQKLNGISVPVGTIGTRVVPMKKYTIRVPGVPTKYTITSKELWSTTDQ
jgi:hypothetical protein